MTSPPGPNSLRRDKTCHIRHLGYYDREELERQDVRIDVPGDIQRSGKWVTAAYDILTDSLYPRSTAINIEHKFLALSDLDHILSEEFTEDLLREAFQHESGPTPEVKDIHGPSFKSRRKQILATLILIEGVPLIKTFVKAGVFDDALPLAIDHPIFTSWKRKDRIDFHSQQYAVLAPFFNFSSDKMRHYVLPLNTRMPFMEPQTRIGRGKDGDIWRTSIHPDHQYWEASKFYGRYFAVKEFSSSNDDEDDFKTFKSEKRALKRFSGPNKGHPHLIRLLLSYQIGERYFMIFQLAESNLKELWKKREVNTEAPDDLTWLNQQCYGVSRGLQKIHRHDSWLLRYGGSVHKRNQNRGRHGDIKPENILCFGQPEPEKFRLVIADFTLMRFHGESSLGLSLARGMAHSPKYRPPELNLSHRTKVNQSYDIWTLGCVFLEFLTWYLLGDQAVYGNSFVESGTGRVLQTFDLVRWHDDDKIYGYQENKFFSLVPNSSAPQVKKSVTQVSQPRQTRQSNEGPMLTRLW
jgi:serine/threonine protein kinase